MDQGPNSCFDLALGRLNRMQFIFRLEVIGDLVKARTHRDPRKRQRSNRGGSSLVDARHPPLARRASAVPAPTPYPGARAASLFLWIAHLSVTRRLRVSCVYLQADDPTLIRTPGCPARRSPWWRRYAVLAWRAGWTWRSRWSGRAPAASASACFSRWLYPCPIDPLTRL